MTTLELVIGAQASLQALDVSQMLVQGVFCLTLQACSNLGTAGLSLLAETGALASLRVLDVSQLPALKTPASAGLLPSIISAARGRLEELAVDGASLGTEQWVLMCPLLQRLRSLSLVGCTGLTDRLVAALGCHCSRLQCLLVGGGSMAWREGAVLEGFQRLQSLTFDHR